MTTRALIIGAGDTGTRIINGGHAQGWQCTGLVHSEAGIARVRTTGATPLAVDLDAPLPVLPSADVIFYCAPPPREGHDDPRMAQILAAYPPESVQRLIYISTSGVYGDCQGKWVDETRALNPGSPRSHRRAAAEQRIADWGGDHIILRAPGIYGPDRLPIDRVRAGQPILAGADAPWTNRIHVTDLAEIALTAAKRGPARVIYNASDGNPTPMPDYYHALAKRLGCPPPPEIDWATAEQTFSAMRLSFLRESRRLSNQRLRETLGMTLHYPDYQTGLDACLSCASS